MGLKTVNWCETSLDVDFLLKCGQGFFEDFLLVAILTCALLFNHVCISIVINIKNDLFTTELHVHVHVCKC